MQFFPLRYQKLPGLAEGVREGLWHGAALDKFGRFLHVILKPYKLGLDAVLYGFGC